MRTGIEIEGIGVISLVRNKTYKNLRLSVNSKQEVRISAPFFISDREAISFAESKKDWILKAIQKQESQKKTQRIFTEDSEFSTLKHKLELKKHQSNKLTGQIRQGVIQLRIPEVLPIESEQAQDFIRQGIEQALRIEAKAYLPSRTRELAEKYSFETNQIRVKNNKSNWGSCSYQNNINLNIHLMRLPVHLSDYVILHELCHTVHRNHGEGFWKLLNKICKGRAKHLAFEMKAYHPQTL